MANNRREYRYKGLVSDVHVWQVTEPDGLETYFFRLQEEETARASAYEKLKSLGFSDKEMSAMTNPEFTKGTTNFVVTIPNFSNIIDSIQ